MYWLSPFIRLLAVGLPVLIMIPLALFLDMFDLEKGDVSFIMVVVFLGSVGVVIWYVTQPLFRHLMNRKQEKKKLD